MKRDLPTCVEEFRVLDKAMKFCSKIKWVPCDLYPRSHPSPHVSSRKKAK